jgi:PAS domain S-box-containing protein
MYRPPTITPTDVERFLKEDDLIVSKTDTASRITYASESFCEIAGYTYEELRGKPHCIIRHPCMPRAVFSLMWEHLKQEKEFLGYVKNMSSDGSFYWTFASIAPTYDKGEVVGYMSSRRAPTREALSTIEPIYQRMREAEMQLSPDQQIPASSALLWQEISREYQSYAEYILSL